MCGRFVLTTPGKSLASHFRLSEEPMLEPRYNIAPTQKVAVIRMERAAGPQNLALLRWGLIPSWSKEGPQGAGFINARSETAAEKPAFRASFRHRRCLIPADAFYEWKKTQDRKQPYLFRRADRNPFVFAGLWDRWHGPDGTVIESVTVLTVTANALVEPIHDRMPAILLEPDYELWCDNETSQPDAVKLLLKPYPAEWMVAYPVSPRVNRSDYEAPDIIEPLETD